MSRRLACLLFAGAALAGTPVPAAAQANDWSGFYVGVDLGLASGRLGAATRGDCGTNGAFIGECVFQLTNVNPPGPQPLTVVPGTTVLLAASDRQVGFVYGGVAGFAVQPGNWVLGIEADAHGPRDSGAVSVAAVLPPTALEPSKNITLARDARISWDWSVRGRIGYDLGQTMLYAAGGVASARVRLRGEDSYQVPAGNASPTSGNPPFANPGYGPITISNSGRGTLTGWTAGGGGEYRLSRHLSLGLDARYTDYGSTTIELPACLVNSIAQGQCPQATLTGGGTITFPAGTTPASINPSGQETYPYVAPDDTRISLSEWRASVRLIFRF